MYHIFESVALLGEEKREKRVLDVAVCGHGHILCILSIKAKRAASLRWTKYWSWSRLLCLLYSARNAETFSLFGRNFLTNM